MRRLWVSLFLATVLLAAAPPRAQNPQPAAPPVSATPDAQTPTPPPPTNQGGYAGGGMGAGRPDNADADFAAKDPIPARTAAEEAKTFVLPPGYRMELVLSDPQIISPAVIEFDGNGRMYVAEFLTYMPDADGNHEHDPINRITRWESTKGDGRYDKRTVFVDKLVLPRMILPLQDGVILTNETDSDDVVKWTDTNGDGIADRKDLFFTGVGLGRDGNLEHEQSGFVWSLDNWIYSTYNAFRFRWTPNGILREPTAPNAGQWGLSIDDDGKPWFVDAGGERGPMNFQVPVQYGAFNFPDSTEPGFENIWPIAGASDVEGGMVRVRMPIGVLNHFSATNGPAIVRGHRLPADLQGDLLVCEPVGRLIRRAKVVRSEGLTQLRNANPGSEFLLSSDLYFRPVNIRTGPDGLMYIADLYHGIIQESQWTRPRSYLRQKIEQYQFDKVIDHGRIWRLRYDGVPGIPALPGGPGSGSPGHPAVPAIEPDFTLPRMYSETPAQLLTHLTHPNGWWRDTAQRLLVLAQDTSVVSTLQTMARSADALVGRFHAMWTLEGLGALDAALVREQMNDPNPRMRVQAIRASETLYKRGDKSFVADYRAMTRDPDPDVVIQALLTLNLFKTTDVADVIKTAQAANKARGVTAIGNRLLAAPGALPGTAAATGRGDGAGRTPEEQDLMRRGGAIFTELCFTCHGDDGRGAPLAGVPGATIGPPLAGSPRVQGHRDYVVKVLLNGLTGPVGDGTYPEVMLPMGVNTDEWIAAAASYVRNSFGNTAGLVTAADVKRVRAETRSRKTPWTVAEIEPTLPKIMEANPTSWHATASHNAAAAARALTLAGWTSGGPQQPGMWFQIELPAAARIAEIQFDSAVVGRAGGAGQGSAGAAPAQGAVSGSGANAEGATRPAAGRPAGAASAPGGAGRGDGAPAPRGGAVPPGAPPSNASMPVATPPGAPRGQGAPAPGRPGGPAPFGAPPQGPPILGFPRGYKVQTSMDGAKWSAPVAEGAGKGARTVIAFTPVDAKYLRITETDAVAGALAWSMMNLRIFEIGH